MFNWFRSRRRAAALREQWPSALLFLAGALKAGLSLEQALASLQAEAPEPLRSLLARRVDRTWMLLPITARVEKMFMEPELALARAALLLTQSTGGQSARLLERSANSVRIKNEIEDRARALSAQGRVSAWVVGLTPVGILLLFALFSPDYLAPLFTTGIGIAILGVVLLMLAVGLALVHTLARVDA